MARKSSTLGDGLSEESLAALFEHINSARIAKGLPPFDLVSREFWSFCQDIHEAAAEYHRKPPTKAEFRKAIRTAVTQAGKTRATLIEVQGLVKPFGPEFVELRTWISALFDFESEWADKPCTYNSDQRFEHLVLHLKLAWEVAEAGKAAVSRPPEGASQQRPRQGLFASFVEAVLDVIDPSHKRSSVARSLEDILPRFNFRKTTPRK